MTHDEFLKVLLVFESFGLKNEGLEDIQLDAWFASMQDLDFEKVKKAIVVISRTKTSWFETDNPPAIIRKAVNELPKKPKVPALIRQIGDWRAKQKQLKQGGE